MAYVIIVTALAISMGLVFVCMRNIVKAQDDEYCSW